ncbi:MAG: hypothetical protein HYX24_04390 [Candidatus Aenigmarchaeota archaeon]|nr:hypothetical protein [Candidatus Aenigmarchaeota archaeon]
MANLYVNKQGPVWNPPNYVQQEASLASFLTSERMGYIEGIIFIELGTERWMRYLDECRASLKQMEFGDEEIEEKLRNLDSGKHVQNGKIISGTSFKAVKYPHLDMCPFENFLTDPDSDIICNIRLDGKQIDVLPYSRPDRRPRAHYFYDISKAMGEGILYYDGSLMDALEEFQQKGFGFNIARWPLAKDFSLETVSFPKGNYVVIKENAPLNAILSGR